MKTLREILTGAWIVIGLTCAFQVQAGPIGRAARDLLIAL